MTDKNLLIKHKRFLYGNQKEIKNIKYFEFFEKYCKINYELIDVNCLCGNKDDQIISMVDRYAVKFDTVICKNCGLVRAPKYFKNENVIDFYKNHYRKIMSLNESDYISPEQLYEQQKITAKDQLKIISQISKKKIENSTILDLGGGVGGRLEYFNKNNQLYLADFFDPYLNYAKGKGINVIKGGLGDIKFKPDVIILSHVMEHWNNFELEMQNLIKIQKKNLTINYIEFPGIDSLKLGRRGGDFLEDLHVPHIYYFASYVFENLMNRFGFEKIYIDSEIKSLFIYTGKINKLQNHFQNVKNDLIKAENVIKKYKIKNKFRITFPALYNFIKKIIN